MLFLCELSKFRRLLKSDIYSIRTTSRQPFSYSNIGYCPSPDVNKNIETPLPTLELSDDGVPITPLLAALAINQNNNYNPYGPLYSTSTTGYPSTSPYYPTTTGYPYAPQSASSGGCSPSYPDISIRDPPPSLACEQVSSRNFRVLPPDPHRFDDGRDRIGCEA